MGQKINPVGLRLGINRTWDSRWFADGPDYGRLLHEDIKVRRALKKKLYQAGVSRIIIERPHKKCRITIYAARPGVIIGKKGADIEKLRSDVVALTGGEVHLNIVEIRKPETDAQLVAENIAQQLERRIAFRRAMKRSLRSVRASASYIQGCWGKYFSQMPNTRSTSLTLLADMGTNSAKSRLVCIICSQGAMSPRR